MPVWYWLQEAAHAHVYALKCVIAEHVIGGAVAKGIYDLAASRMCEAQPSGTLCFREYA